MANGLIKAELSADFLRKDLQDALRHATAVEGLLILQMIEQAAKLEQSIGSLLAAKNSLEGDQRESG